MEHLTLLEGTKKRPRDSSDTNLEDSDFTYNLGGLRTEGYDPLVEDASQKACLTSFKCSND